MNSVTEMWMKGDRFILKLCHKTLLLLSSCKRLDNIVSLQVININNKFFAIFGYVCIYLWCVTCKTG